MNNSLIHQHFRAHRKYKNGNDLELCFEGVDAYWLLGLANTAEAVSSLPDDQKSTFRINEGGPQHIVINLKGFNRLIIKSRVKSAIKVQE
ncbi:MAG: hypothetical protein ACTSSH_09140 [Candidatus Heimdallarchaeota archaeon]